MVRRQLKFTVNLDFSGAIVLAAMETSSEMQAVWERVGNSLRRLKPRTKPQLTNARG